RGAVGGRHAAGPGHVQRIGEAEVVGQDAEAGAAVAAGVLIGFVNPRGSPVRTAEGADASGTGKLVEDVDGPAHRDVGVVPMHHVQVRVVGALFLERLGQLPGDRFRIAVRGVGALGDDHHVLADAAVLHPFAQQLLGVAAAVDVGGVEGGASDLV